MKSRTEVVRFIEAQFQQLGDSGKIGRNGESLNVFHYGRNELRGLLDFIYQGTPESIDEQLPDTRLRD